MREHPLPQLTIQQLDYLVSVADHDTWADAASSLGVTPSALSQGLAELERRLGFELFERAGRRRVIAGRSRPVVDFARRVLAEADDLGRWVARVTGGDTGSLRIGMIDAAAIGHYGEMLRRFREAHADIDLTLTVAPSGELLDQLVNGALDVAVVVQPAEQPATIGWIEVLEEPLAVYAPPGHEVGPPATWGPWVSFNPNSHTRRLVAEAVADAGATFDVVAESNQPDVLREMVRLGMGWTVLPVIQAEIQPSPLSRARPTPLLTRTLVAATRRGAVTNPLTELLVDQLLSWSRSASPVQSAL